MDGWMDWGSRKKKKNNPPWQKYSNIKGDAVGMGIEKTRNTCKENIVPSKECKYLVIKEFRNKTNTPG